MKVTFEVESRKGSARVDVKLILEDFAPSFDLDSIKHNHYMFTGTKKGEIISNKKHVWVFILDRRDSKTSVKEMLERYASDIIEANLKLFMEYPELNLTIVKEVV